MSDKQERGKEKLSSGKRKMIKSNKTVTNGPGDKFPPDHNDIDNPVDKEEANPDGTSNRDQKLTDDYTSVQEVALGELDTSENKKEELAESTEEEESETEKNDNNLKELKNDHEVSSILIAKFYFVCIYIYRLGIKLVFERGILQNHSNHMMLLLVLCVLFNNLKFMMLQVALFINHLLSRI